MRRTLFLSALFALCLSFLAQAQPTQDKAELEKERQQLQKELQEIQGLYDKVKGQTKQSLGQLNVINQKINVLERYIGSISKEVKMIDDDIYLSNLEIYRLQKQLDTLKIQYARTVVYAYKNRSSYDYLNFIFSSGSFNDVLKRIAYLKSYRAYREKQVNSILETQDLIAKRKKQQLTRKDQKNLALQNQTKQANELSTQKNEKASVVNKLKSQEKDLQKQIATKKKKDKDMSNAIMAIIRRDIKAAEDKAKADAVIAKKKADDEAKKNNVTNNSNTNTTTTTPKTEVIVKKPDSYLELNAKDVALGSDFLKSKGKLPWPVDNGVVSINFGPYSIEGTILKGVNPGITIATQAGTTVKAVFEGEVRGVFNLGDGMAVSVRHGKYYTTYSNLSSVSVKKGDLVKTGQSVGRAGRDEDGTGGQIDFILMVETKEVNPQPWLRR